MRNRLLRNVAVILNFLLAILIIFSSIIITKYSNSYGPADWLTADCFVVMVSLVVGIVLFVLSILKRYFRLQRMLSYIMIIPLFASVFICAKIFTSYYLPKLDMGLIAANFILNIVIILILIIDYVLSRKSIKKENELDKENYQRIQEQKAQNDLLPHYEIHNNLLEKLAQIGSVLAIICYSAFTIALLIMLFMGYLKGYGVAYYVIFAVLLLASIMGITISILTNIKSSKLENYLKTRPFVVSLFCLDSIYVVELLTISIELIKDWLVVSFILLVLAFVLAVSAVFMMIAMFDKEHIHEMEEKKQPMAIYGAIFSIIAYTYITINSVSEIVNYVLTVGNIKTTTILWVVMLLLSIIGLVFNRIILTKTSHHESLKEVKFFIFANIFITSFFAIYLMVFIPEFIVSSILGTLLPIDILTNIILIMVLSLLILGSILTAKNLAKTLKVNVKEENNEKTETEKLDFAYEIEKAKILLDKELITEEEFVKIKEKIIANI